MSEIAKKMKKEDLAKLAELAQQFNVEVDRPQLPVMKINYDPDSKYERGVWVVGQKKDENGNIVDEGQIVKEFVLLAIYNRYSLYDETDTKKNCKSPLHTIAEVGSVRGDNYGYICGAKCPHRAGDAKPRCSAQKVLFGVAITEAGEKIDCVAYIKGAGYMPLVDYLKKHPTQVGSVDVPIFAHTIALSSRKEKNKGTVYFVPVFETGDILPMAEIQAMAKKAASVKEYVNNDKQTKTVEPENDVVTAIPTEATVVAEPDDDDDDIPMEAIMLDKKDAAKSKPATADEEEEDIEAKIAKLIGG